MNKVMMVDPPSGWQYGFPKAMPLLHRPMTLAWLVENGYPQEEIDSYGDHFYVRMWEVEVEETPAKTGT